MPPLLQHLLHLYDLSLDTKSTSLRSPLLQPIQRYYDLYWYSIYNVTLISHHNILKSPWSLLVQQLLRHYDTIVTASTTSLCTLLLQQLWRPYDPPTTAYIISLWSLSLQHLLCHYTLFVTASITSLWSLLSQHILRHNDLHCYSTHTSQYY